MSSKESYPSDDVKGASDDGPLNAHPLPVKTKPWWKLGGKDYGFVSIDAGYPKQVNSASSSDTQLDGSLDHNVYETEDTKEIYQPIEGYEGAHRFDPSLEWDPQEEKRLVKIVSLPGSRSSPLFLLHVMS